MIYGFFKKERKLTGNIVDFVNNMTHEFKTPLTNISLANSMISKSETVEHNKKLSFYSQIIKTEHDKLKQRVEELLKNSFSESGTPFYNESIDVCSVVENVIETYSVQMKDKGGNFSFWKEGENFIIKGNIDQFYIALGNIIDNAIRYSRSEPEIKIFLTSKNRSVRLMISDNGIGIAREHLSHIFEKYYRVPTGNVHDNNGFGLGLYHVKNIVSKMGGKIKVASSKGKGSRFSLDFQASESI
jgi:two-component system phosphate regulon sensor histidine kinase PhoR